MSFTAYQITIPVFINMLHNLAHVLHKANDYLEVKKIAPEVLINLRLAPDMFPLSRQIQMASDTAKGCAARLAELDVPSFPDTEATLSELQERISKTITFLESIPKDKLNNSEDRTIVMKARSTELTFKGSEYILNFALPNFYFHITTAYAILRHNGVDIGKMDYLGKV